MQGRPLHPLWLTCKYDDPAGDVIDFDFQNAVAYHCATGWSCSGDYAFVLSYEVLKAGKTRMMLGSGLATEFDWPDSLGCEEISGEDKPTGGYYCGPKDKFLAVGGGTSTGNATSRPFLLPPGTATVSFMHMGGKLTWPSGLYVKYVASGARPKKKRACGFHAVLVC